MKKLTIFILLLIILGACGFTFYSMYNSLSPQENDQSHSQTQPEEEPVYIKGEDIGTPQYTTEQSAHSAKTPFYETIYESLNGVWFLPLIEKGGCHPFVHLDKDTGTYHRIASVNSCGNREFIKKFQSIFVHLLFVVIPLMPLGTWTAQM